MAFITIAGQNQIAKKQGDNVTLNIASFVLANVPDLGSEPATRIESIPNGNVVDQLVVTKSGYVNTNQVVYSLVMGSDIGNYSFNWVGLVDDEGVLIAVTYIPLTPKMKNDGGVPGNTITRNFLLAYTGIQQTTAITVPAETWQIDFSARLSGIDERERLSNLDIYGHEGFLGHGWKVTGSASTYSVAAGIGYVGGIRAKNIAPQEITTATFPNEIWLNVSLQGDISDMIAVCEFVIDTGPFEDYVDGNGITHYLTKIADIDAAGEVSDGRSIFEVASKAYSEDVSNAKKGVMALDRLPVMSSPTDNADGKLPYVGSYYAGRNFYEILNADDLYNELPSGFWNVAFTNFTLNRPDGLATFRGWVRLSGSGYGFVFIISDETVPRIFTRSLVGGDWGEWLPVFTGASVSTSADVMAGISDSKPVTPKSLKDAGITDLVASQFGVGQGIYNVTGERFLNTATVNVSEKVMVVYLVVESGSNRYVTLDSGVVSTTLQYSGGSSGSGQQVFMLVVPSGWSYTLTGSLPSQIVEVK